MTPATRLHVDVVHRDGLCDEPCGHRECATGWQIADSLCGLDCGERIGFGQPYLECDGHGLVHRGCWLDLYESKPVDFGTSFAEWFPCPEAVQWAGRS